MRSIAKNIGNNGYNLDSDPTAKFEAKRILISRPNGRLGNLLLITPLIEEVIATFPECKIDLFVKGKLAPVLFKNYKNIEHIIELPGKPFKHLINYIGAWVAIKKRRYDIVVNVVSYSSSGRLSAKLSNSKYRFFGDINEELQSKHPDYKHIAKHSVYNFRNYLSLLGFNRNNKPVPSLNLKLNSVEIAEGKRNLRKLFNNSKETICLFTYATGDKCYSDCWWAEFYEKLKQEYKNHNIVEVLPKENISRINFAAPTFYSKNIREIGALIANTKIFIGADSGIMHLASSVKTTTIGLFSITNPEIYQPYGNNSIAINTNDSCIDQCLKIIDNILIDD